MNLTVLMPHAWPTDAVGVVRMRKTARASNAATDIHTALLTACPLSCCTFTQLVDLRPTERAYNKNYCYAENHTGSFFLQFPTKKTFDHRKL